MIPIMLHPGAAPIAVAGRGPAALRRFATLRAGGGAPLLFSDRADEVAEAGPLLRPRLPGAADLAALRVLWVTGLPDDIAATLATDARAARVLVNVEDRPLLCDFHSAAEIRRGDLLLTVSTGGASPRLAARIRARLASEFGAAWGERLALLRTQRDAWRRDGADVSALTDALLESSLWLA